MSSKFSKTLKFRRALQRKGFRDLGSGKDHHWMVLFVDSKRTHIKTKVSRGSKEISARLFSAIYKKLEMPSHTYLMDFLECPITYEDYVRHLLAKEESRNAPHE